MRLLFFLSGAASLIYQVLWTRQLSLVFGNTIQAASTTVACFLLGLGLGAALGGKIGPRRTNLGRDFALAEFSVALCGLLVTAVIPHIASWVPALGSNPTVARFFLVFLLLILPCLAMGITLPLLCQREERLAPGHFGRALGSLYSINTLGAACGALATDFLLVPDLGVHATVLVAGGLNLTVAVLAFATGRPGVTPAHAAPTPSFSGGFSPRACLLLLGFSGFIGLSLEILWIRMLVFVNGGDVYAFSETLFVYLIGIVLGSLAAGYATERKYRLDKLTTLLFIALSFTSVLSLWVAVSLPNRTALPAFLAPLPYEYLRLIFAGCILLPSNLCLGALFPILNTLLRGSRQDAAEAVGQGYFWNTVGSLLGSLSTGFLLIPALGMQKSLFMVGGVCALTGGWLAVRTVRGVSTRAIAALILLAYWTGLALVPPNAAILRLFNEPSRNILFLTEDHYGTVALIRQHENYEADDYTNLIIDGYNMAGNSRTAKRYTAMLALAPMLLAPEPKNVLVVAFGLCNTLTTAVRLPESVHVDCAELSPRVVEATSHLDYARRTLRSDKLTLVFGDGRNHLTSTQKTYDVITAEPPPPIHAGIVNLYSREYYQLCRSRLNPKGVVAQWLPIDQMSKFESQTIVRAFLDVFPYSYVWCGADAHLILIGSMEPITVDYDRVKKVFAANQDWLSVAGWDDPALFVASCVRGPRALADYVKNIPPLTDDRPYIQYWKGPRDFDIASYEASFPSPEIAVIHADSPDDKAAIAKAATVLQTLSRFQYFGSQDALLNELTYAKQRWDILATYPNSQYFQTVTQSSPRHYEQYRAIATRNPSGHWLLARTLAGRGEFQQALDEMALWKEPSPTRSALEAMLLARAGRVADVEKILQETQGIPEASRQFLEREKSHWAH